MTSTITAERIDLAIAWYEGNIEAIAAVLPIHTPGITYNVGCLKSVSSWISIWQTKRDTKKAPLYLAGCYLHGPITVFYRELRRLDEPKRLEEKLCSVVYPATSATFSVEQSSRSAAPASDLRCAETLVYDVVAVSSY